MVHPHVVRTHEYGSTTRGEHYLVMDFVEGYNFQYLRDVKLGGPPRRSSGSPRPLKASPPFTPRATSITISTREISCSAAIIKSS